MYFKNTSRVCGCPSLYFFHLYLFDRNSGYFCIAPLNRKSKAKLTPQIKNEEKGNTSTKHMQEQENKGGGGD